MISNNCRQKKLCNLFTSLLFISLTQSAIAFTAPLWQGSYLGVYYGGGFGNNRISTKAGTATDTSYFTTAADINSVNNAGSWTDNPNSAIAGILAGHDWALNQQIVCGVVFDYSALPLSSSKNVNGTYPSDSSSYSVYTSMNTNWLFTLRARLGYQFMFREPTLLYITGGTAITQLKVSNSINDNSSYAGIGRTQATQNKIGWTLGAGIELASSSHSSVSFEYLYVQVPPISTTASVSNTQGGFGIPVQSLTSPLTTTGKFQASLLKMEFNYRFDE